MPLFKTETSKIVEYIWTAARAFDKLGISELIRMYFDDFRDMIIKELKATFSSEAFRRLKPIVTTEVNILRKVVDETAMVYKEPARRSCIIVSKRNTESQDQNQENISENQEVKRYQDIVSHSRLNTVMKLVNRFTRLCNHVLIHVVAREGKIEYDLITPDYFDIYSDPSDWKKIVAIAYLVGQKYPGVGQPLTNTRQIKKIWTKEAVRIDDQYLEAGKIYSYQGKQLLKVEDNPYRKSITKVVNGKAEKAVEILLPFVLTYKNYPVGSLLNFTDGSSLFTSNITINVMLTLVNEILKYQSFNQPYMIMPDQTKTPETMIMGPWAILQLKVPQGFKGEIGTLQLQTDPEAVWRVIENRIFYILAQNGVPPSSYQLSRSPQSGISLKIERRALEEIRENDIEYYRDFETSLFEITRVVNNLHSEEQIPSEAKFSIDFAEPRYDHTIQEVIQKETHELANNLTTTAKLLMKRNPDLDLVDAGREIEENRRANTPVAPVPGIIGDALSSQIPNRKSEEAPVLTG